MPSLMAMLGLNWSGFKGAADASVAYAQQAGGKISSALGHSVTHHLAGLATIGTLEEVARRTIEYGEQVSILSQHLGISTDAVQQWDYALKLNGTSLEANAKFFEQLAVHRKAALSGTDKDVAAFKALGVSLDDLKNKRLEDVALQISKMFEGADPQKFIADLREVGGRSAGEMVAAFQGGIGELIGTAPVIQTEVIDKLREAADAMKQIGMEARAIAAPGVAWLAEKARDAFHGVQIAYAGISTALKKGLGFGGAQAGLGAAAGKALELFNATAAAKDAAERRKKAAGLGGVDGENTKEGRAAAKDAAEKERLMTRLEDLQNKHYVASLSKEQQITELHRRRAELAYWLAENWGKLSESGRLKAQIDVETLKGEEEEAQRQLDKPKHHKSSSPSVNALQGIGAFAAGPPLELQALQVHQKSEKHLEQIHKGIERLVGHAGKGHSQAHTRARF